MDWIIELGKGSILVVGLGILDLKKGADRGAGAAHCGSKRYFVN